jgi:HEAT repeat protein
MSQVKAETVRKLLESTDDEQRWYEEVRALDPAQAVPVLAAILHDEAETLLIRSRAALMLAVRGDERGIPPLIQALDDSEPVLRARVARALARFARLDQSAVRRLIVSLGDDDYFVRESSAKTLGDLRQSEALPALEEMSLTDVVPENRKVAEEAIKAIKGIT